MPRIVGQSVPKYRKHRATGQAVCTVSGKDYYLGPHGTKASRIEYDRLIAEWLVNGRQPLGESDDNLTVSELIAHYWRFTKSHYVKNGKPTSEQASIKVALRLVRELYGNIPAIEFGPLALKAVRLKQIQTGLSRRSVNQNLGRIKRMFKWAVSEQLVPAETFQALATVVGLRQGRTEAHDNPPVMPVDDSAVEATLPHLPSIVADMVTFQRATGCRPEECCSLRPCDLDRSGDVWVYKPGSHKTEHHGRTRLIFVGPQAQAILLRYLARDAQAFCFRPCDSEVKRKPKKKPGEKYTTGSYRRAIHRACDRAGVPRWSPNRLRHSAATEIRKKFGLESAQVVLGHASADITQVYAERDNSLAIEVAAKIG